MPEPRPRLPGVLLLILLLLLVLGGAALLVFGGGEADTPTAPAGSLGATPDREPHKETPPLRRDRPRTEQGESVTVADATTPPPDAVARRPSQAPVAKQAELHVTVRDGGGGTVADSRLVAFNPFASMGVALGDEPDVHWTQTATTDATGKATLTFARTGLFLQVIAEREGLAGLSERVSLQPGGSESIEIELAPATHVVGKVTDRTGAPIREALVEAQLRSGSITDLSLATRSDERGDYAFPGVPTSLLAGSQTVSVSAPGYSPSNLGFVPKTGDVRLDFELEPGRSVVGRCVEAGGLPVAGARVVWEATEFETDDDGRFAVGVLPLSGGTVTIVPRRFAPVAVVVPAGPPGEVDVGEIVVVAGSPISGLVIDRDGKPVADAHVNVLSKQLGQWVRVVKTGEDGRFELANMGAGPHRVTVMKSQQNGSQLEAERDDVLAGTTDITLTLGGGSSVLVKFLAAGDRSVVKVDDATISAVSTDAGANKVTWGYAGSNLTQARIPVEQPGVYDVTVKIPGYEEGLASGVVVADGQETVIDVLFSKSPE